MVTVEDAIIRRIKKQAQILPNGTLSVPSDYGGGALFLMVIGGWNYSQISIVMPNNGGTPIKKTLASYSEGSTNFPVSANGSWGFTITNNTAYAVPCSVYIIPKT